MKRNEFGEIENPRNKVNVFILIVAIVAVIVTGVVYAVKLNTQAQDLNARYETSMEYCQK